jgi:hypothetical protein
VPRILGSQIYAVARKPIPISVLKKAIEPRRPARRHHPPRRSRRVFLLLNEGLVIRMVKDLRQSTGVANASRITLEGAITKRQFHGTLESLMNQTEKVRGAQPGANTDV